MMGEAAGVLIDDVDDAIFDLPVVELIGGGLRLPNLLLYPGLSTTEVVHNNTFG